MNLQDLVCDYELAVKLKELGLRLDTLFSYRVSFGKLPYVELWDDYLINSCSDFIRAYTADELMGMLPDEVESHYMCLEKHDNKFHVSYCSYGEHECSDSKLPNTLSKLLIWCIENEYVKVEDLNNAKI